MELLSFWRRLFMWPHVLTRGVHWHNIDTITIALRKAVDRQSRDTAYQRATSLMERIV